MKTIVAALILAALPCAASAQDMSSAFTGFHAGPAVTAVNHGFVIEEEFNGVTTRRFNVSRWGVGGEVFAGYDLALAPRITLGAEAAFNFGGRAAVERNPDYTFGIDPRHGFSVTARLGYVASPRFLLYAGGGYGEQRYTVITSDPDPSDRDFANTRSFILRGGVEYAVTPRANIRLEFQHLDGTRNQFMLGVPIRF